MCRIEGRDSPSRKEVRGRRRITNGMRQVPPGRREERDSIDEIRKRRNAG